MNRRGADRIGPLGSSGVIAQWGASSLIKSVQHLTPVMSSANSVTNTITAVVPENTVIVVTGFTNGGVSQNDMYASVVLTNSTTLTTSRNTTSGSAGYTYGTTIGVEVVEYFPGVIKSVQRGTANMASSPSNVTITAVNLNKSVISRLGWRCNNTNAPTTYIEMYPYISSSTLIQWFNGTANSIIDFNYQVVEFF